MKLLNIVSVTRKEFLIGIMFEEIDKSTTSKIMVRSIPVKNISRFGLILSLNNKKNPTTGRRIPTIKR